MTMAFSTSKKIYFPKSEKIPFSLMYRSPNNPTGYCHPKNASLNQLPSYLLPSLTNPPLLLIDFLINFSICLDPLFELKSGTINQSPTNARNVGSSMPPQAAG